MRASWVLIAMAARGGVHYQSQVVLEAYIGVVQLYLMVSFDIKQLTVKGVQFGVQSIT